MEITDRKTALLFQKRFFRLVMMVGHCISLLFGIANNGCKNFLHYFHLLRDRKAQQSFHLYIDILPNFVNNSLVACPGIGIKKYNYPSILRLSTTNNTTTWWSIHSDGCLIERWLTVQLQKNEFLVNEEYFYSYLWMKSNQTLPIIFGPFMKVCAFFILVMLNYTWVDMLKQLKVIYFYVTCYPTSNASTDEILHDIIAFVAITLIIRERSYIT